MGTFFSMLYVSEHMKYLRGAYRGAKKCQRVKTPFFIGFLMCLNSSNLVGAFYKGYRETLF